MHDLIFLKLFCSSKSTLLESTNFDNLVFKIDENTFETVDINEMPLQFVGILGSLPGFTMGHNNFFDQMLGTTPEWKQKLKKFCNTMIIVLHFKISFGILLIPTALPFLAAFIAMLTSYNVILPFRISLM